MTTYISPPNSKKRDASVKVMLTASMRQQLEEVASALGQTPGTAASFAIGLWVSQQLNAARLGDKTVAHVAQLFEPLAQEMTLLVRKGLE